MGSTRTLISLWPPNTARAFARDTAMWPGAPEDLTPDMDLDASHVRDLPSTPALQPALAHAPPGSQCHSHCKRWGGGEER